MLLSHRTGWQSMMNYGLYIANHRILSLRGRCRRSVECLSSGGLYIFHESGYSIIQENQWLLSFIDWLRFCRIIPHHLYLTGLNLYWNNSEEAIRCRSRHLSIVGYSELSREDRLCSLALRSKARVPRNVRVIS